MHVEVDQSGKTEKMNVDTVLAFSNGKSAAVLIPAETKKACLQALRRKGKPKITSVLRVTAQPSGATHLTLPQEPCVNPEAASFHEPSASHLCQA